jgi:recombinational DNA repair protein RecT
MTAPAEAREERAESLTSMLLSPAARKIIEVNLPPGVKLERVARAVAKLAHEKPDLLECTGRSIVEAVARGVRFNLELGRFWYLIPHDVVIKRRGHEDKKEKRARFQLDYKGEAAFSSANASCEACARHVCLRTSTSCRSSGPPRTTA